jgi:hypothetical protein
MARDGILPNGLMSVLSAFTRHFLLWVALGADGVGIHSWTGEGESKRDLNLTGGGESQEFIYIVGLGIARGEMRGTTKMPNCGKGMGNSMWGWDSEGSLFDIYSRRKSGEEGGTGD